MVIHLGNKGIVSIRLHCGNGSQCDLSHILGYVVSLGKTANESHRSLVDLP